jgi:hypothetical protein
LDPFEEEISLQHMAEQNNGVEDSDFEMAIGDVEDGPSLLHVSDGEE